MLDLVGTGRKLEYVPASVIYDGDDIDFDVWTERREKSYISYLKIFISRVVVDADCTDAVSHIAKFLVPPPKTLVRIQWNDR